MDGENDTDQVTLVGTAPPTGFDSIDAGDFVTLADDNGLPVFGKVLDLTGGDVPMVTVQVYDQNTNAPTDMKLQRSLAEVQHREPPPQITLTKAVPKFAVAADKDHPAKLPLGNKGQIEGAITVVITGKFRGNDIKPPLSDTEKAEARRNIEAAINESGEADDWKKAEKARLHGSAGDDSAKSSAVDVPAELEREVSIAVKSLDLDGNEIGGYAVLFGSAGQRDTTGEWFTKNTDYALAYYDKRPILYDHSMDQTIKADMIGTVTDVEVDDNGVWVTGQLDRRNRYVKQVKELIRKGALGWSSGSIQHIARRKETGEIIRWPLAEFSTTPVPAEPRTLAVPMKHYSDERVLSLAYKSLNQDATLLGLKPQESVREGRQENVQNADAGEGKAAKSASDSNVSTTNTHEGDMEFTPEQISAIADALAIKLAPAQPAAQPPAAPATPPAAKSADSQGLPMPEQPAAKGRDISVIGDRRFADLSSQDLSYYANLAKALRLDWRVQNTEGFKVADAFLKELYDDPDRKVQREMAAKAHREFARNELAETALSTLPYKSLAAAEGNDWRPSAFKANELDNTTITNQGAEWVMTIWSDQLWTRVRISNPVASNIQIVNMPSNPYNLPAQGADPVVYFTGEAANATDIVFQGGPIAVSQIKTAKQQITAKKLTVRAVISTEFDEDSIIPVLPDLRAQAVRAMQNYIDDTILNGDTVTTASTNINLIDGTPAAAPSQPAYLAFNGMRKYALITNTAQLVDMGNVAPTLSYFRKARFTMAAQYAVDISNLICIIDISTYQKMLALPEFATFINVGGQGSNLLGTLPGGSSDTVAQAPFPIGKIDGIPVYVSAQLGLTKSGAIGSNGGEISGTPSNNVAGNMVFYHRTRWMLGYRRQVTLDTFSSQFLGDTIQVMSTARVGLVSFDTTSASLLYDINVT